MAASSSQNDIKRALALRARLQGIFGEFAGPKLRAAARDLDKLGRSDLAQILKRGKSHGKKRK